MAPSLWTAESASGSSTTTVETAGILMGVGTYMVIAVSATGNRGSISTTQVAAHLSGGGYTSLVKIGEAQRTTFGWVELWGGKIVTAGTYSGYVTTSSRATYLVQAFAISGQDATGPVDRHDEASGASSASVSLSGADAASLVIWVAWQTSDTTVTTSGSPGTTTQYSSTTIAGATGKAGIANALGSMSVSMSVQGALAAVAILEGGTLFDADAALTLGITGTGSITRIKPADATVTIGVTGTASASVVHSADASLTLGVVGTAAGHNATGHADANLTLGVVGTATAYVIHYADAALTIGITAAAHGGIPRDLHPCVVAGPTGRIVTVCGPTGHATTIGGPHGRVVTAAGPAGRRITTSDPHGRAITVTGPRS